MNVCDCMNPRRLYHKDCFLEEISHHLKRLSDSKEDNLSCKFCQKRLEYSVIRRTKMCKKDILILGIIFISLMAWNGI